MVSFREYTDGTEDLIMPDQLQKPAEGEVHLCMMRIFDLGVIADYDAYHLDQNERERAEKFRFHNDRDAFVMGRYIIKTLLGSYTRQAPQTMELQADGHGKPHCSPGLHFNISHSGDQLLVGISGSEIGVDIELINETSEVVKIAKNHFSDVEFSQLIKSPEVEKRELFFDIWTRKEALIKGIGKGLGIPLKSFHVINPGGLVLWDNPTELNYGDWYVNRIPAPDGYKAAFASKHDRATARRFVISEV